MADVEIDLKGGHAPATKVNESSYEILIFSENTYKGKVWQISILV